LHSDRSANNRITSLAPVSADLRWRGFSEFAQFPQDQPLTPMYGKVNSEPSWRRTPAGWCTRYGPVNELVNASDDALVLANGGDEIALGFDASKLPNCPEGFKRDFFLYVVGWDKDADYHVGQGWRVDPLPFAGPERPGLWPTGAAGKSIHRLDQEVQHSLGRTDGADP
jgi:hypothetical protein